jgi:hypothetical protein
MIPDHPSWEVWIKTLRHWGMQFLVASLLEAAGPLTMLGAQFIYLSQPVLNGIMPGRQVDALATLLEDPAETRQFIVSLRESSLS